MDKERAGEQQEFGEALIYSPVMKTICFSDYSLSTYTAIASFREVQMEELVRGGCWHSRVRDGIVGRVMIEAAVGLDEAR